ncbi:MAG: hypothetical protein ACE5HS_02885 [bacterium]
MKMRHKIWFGGLMGILIFNLQLWGQDKALPQLINGKKFFWEAKFDQSMQALKEVIGIQDAKTEYLFEAYLYMGFVLTRQNAASSEVDAAFEQAVKLDPKRKLDELVIPPDLSERFNRIRRQHVGCVYVTSDPEDIEFVVVQDDSVLYSEFTPILICELMNKKFQLLIIEEDYEEKYMPLTVSSGKVDTLYLSLTPAYTEKKSGKKMWTWFARGGILATAAAVLYKTVIASKGAEVETLPGPPVRPPRN